MNLDVNHLSKVLIFKISGTILLWCIPLLLFPDSLLIKIGIPKMETFLFLRLLGWAYLALCVGYAFALKASLSGKRLLGPIWVGIVSNGGACMYLIFFGLTGTWNQWGELLQSILWISVFATAIITIGLYVFGIKGKEPLA